MKDFFVSFAAPDRKWAEWIAHTVEAAGWSTIFQPWDFRPGSNFVVEMDNALREAQRVIAVLSESYAGRAFTDPEWAAAFAADPRGLAKKLIPVRIDSVALQGLLKAVVYIDLNGLDAAAAKEALLTGLKEGRIKPAATPAFPGAETPRFPTDPFRSAPYLPRLAAEPTDLDQHRFIKDAYAVIVQHFEDGLAALSAATPSIHVERVDISPQKFVAEVFVGGTSRARCKIWLGSPFGSSRSISYVEGWGFSVDDDGTTNDMLAMNVDRAGLYLHALMSSFAPSFLRDASHIDSKRMDAETAAEYLWRRFVQPLDQRR